MAGTEWHLNHSAAQPTQASLLSSNVDRYHLGYQAAQRDDWTFHRSKPSHQLPPGLGYATHNHAGGAVDEPTMFVLRDADLERAPSPDTDEGAIPLGAYREGDVKRLHGDATATKVYANGELDVWMITPTDDNSTAMG